MVAIMPRPMSFLMTSPALTPMDRAMSPTVTTSAMRTTRLLALGTVISVLRCSLPGSARFFRSTRPRGERNSRSLSSMTSCLRMTRFLPLPPLPAFSWPSESAGLCSPRFSSSVETDGLGAGAALRFRSMRPRMRGPTGRATLSGASLSASAAAAPLASTAAPLAPVAAAGVSAGAGCRGSSGGVATSASPASEVAVSAGGAACAAGVSAAGISSTSPAEGAASAATICSTASTGSVSCAAAS